MKSEHNPTMDADSRLPLDAAALRVALQYRRKYESEKAAVDRIKRRISRDMELGLLQRSEDESYRLGDLLSWARRAFHSHGATAAHRSATPPPAGAALGDETDLMAAYSVVLAQDIERYQKELTQLVGQIAEAQSRIAELSEEVGMLQRDAKRMREIRQANRENARRRWDAKKQEAS
ncbi:MAG TPA: hypothetical protein VI279_10815 [Rhodocyclaceae bacterium]